MDKRRKFISYPMLACTMQGVQIVEASYLCGMINANQKKTGNTEIACIDWTNPARTICFNQMAIPDDITLELFRCYNTFEGQQLPASFSQPDYAKILGFEPMKLGSANIIPKQID